MLSKIILQIVLILFNAIFACAEIAMISINDAKLEKLASSGNKKAVTLRNLTSQPARFLATIQVAITLSGFIGAAFAADNFADYITAWAVKVGIPVAESTLRPIAVVLVTLLLSYLTLVFGELVPKRIGMKYSEKLALGMAGMIRFIQIIFAPLVALLNVSTNLVLRLFRIDPNKEENAVTEEEIMMMSDAGEEKGTIDSDENQFIKNIFAFDDLTADQICTHRTDTVVLWMDQYDSWKQIIHETRHSCYPVCQEDVDHVVGMLSARDYFRYYEEGAEAVKQNAVREPFFIPESMKADKLFEQMKQKGASHFAVVLDEYGGMNGVISITDLLEALIGDFDGSSEAEAIKRVDEQTWIIPGKALLTDVCTELDITLPAEDFDSFSGYVISLMGSIPDDNTTTVLETDKLSIEVQRVRRHRIEICRVKKNP